MDPFRAPSTQPKTHISTPITHAVPPGGFGGEDDQSSDDQDSDDQDSDEPTDENLANVIAQAQRKLNMTLPNNVSKVKSPPRPLANLLNTKDAEKRRKTVAVEEDTDEDAPPPSGTAPAFWGKLIGGQSSILSLIRGESDEAEVELVPSTPSAPTTNDTEDIREKWAASRTMNSSTSRSASAATSRTAQLTSSRAALRSPTLVPQPKLATPLTSPPLSAPRPVEPVSFSRANRMPIEETLKPPVSPYEMWTASRKRAPSVPPASSMPGSLGVEPSYDTPGLEDVSLYDRKNVSNSIYASQPILPKANIRILSGKPVLLHCDPTRSVPLAAGSYGAPLRPILVNRERHQMIVSLLLADHRI